MARESGPSSTPQLTDEGNTVPQTGSGVTGSPAFAGDDKPKALVNCRAVLHNSGQREPTGAGDGMDPTVALLINAVIAGLLLGGFYAAVTAGVSVSFGILDIVNIAHPAFIILGSYIVYILNFRLGLDPILISILVMPAFYVFGAGIYQVYYLSFEKRGQEALRGLAFFFGLLFITEVALILAFGVDYRYVDASYIGPTWRFGFVDLPLRMLVPCVVSLLMVLGLQLFLMKSYIGRAKIGRTSCRE